MCGCVGVRACVRFVCAYKGRKSSSATVEYLKNWKETVQPQYTLLYGDETSIHSFISFHLFKVIIYNYINL